MTRARIFSQVLLAAGLCLSSAVFAQAVDTDYVIGVGDVLKVSVYRQPDLETTVVVANDGSVPIGSLGRVPVTGLTAANASQAVASRLKSAGILLNPTVNVVVTEIHSQMVSLLGAVGRPGQYPIDRRGVSVAEMLARAGANFTSGGSLIHISGDGTGAPYSETYTVAELLAKPGGRLARPGESIVVEAPAQVYVRGEVGRPGAFAIEPGMTVDQAIALAGGLTPRGSNHNLRITHADDQGSAPKAVRLSDRVKPSDVVIVGSRLF